ncbi:hypothetical protein HMPREF0733_11248 [Rothia dentocariosa ATCC 17931]|uniref:Uncharacterized protein n=1 Tax=Rothia dentocariosa (strain ATCC 17931 / CDC X599 / XDIA) TaxID=762948 RepID=E3H4S2_ROTDC|nr:hypothetical protein HMPREF0733_11248 [Rothia dentocariosa ATCC 17931]
MGKFFKKFWNSWERSGLFGEAMPHPQVNQLKNKSAVGGRI